MPHPTIQTNSFSRVDHLSRTKGLSRQMLTKSGSPSGPSLAKDLSHWNFLNVKQLILEVPTIYIFLAVLHPYQYQSISFWILMHKGKHIQTFCLFTFHSSLELTVGTDLTNPDLQSPVPFCDLQHKFDMYQDVLLLGAMEIWREPTGRHCMAH